MKKPIYWIAAILLALAFVFVLKNYDAETNSINTSLFNNTISVVKNTANNAVDAVEDGADALEDSIEDGLDAAGDLAEDAVDAVEDGAEAVADTLEDGVEAVEDTIEEMGNDDVVTDNEEESNTVVVENNGYQEFSEEEMKQAIANGKNVVLFFHADRCPTCVALNEKIVEGEDTIDENTVIFKVDYDTATDLTDKYNVTSQHTVVYLDENMEATLSKGGINTLEELQDNIQG